MSSVAYRKLQYQYEVLRARLEIKDHYIRNITRDVYDNISQVLSLVRVQLSLDELEKTKRKHIGKNPNGELLGLAIKDLRDLCNRFATEDELIHTEGFNKALEKELLKLCPAADFILSTATGRSSVIAEDKRLILFSILLNIFSLVAGKQGGLIRSLKLAYTKKELVFDLEISGMPGWPGSYQKKLSGLSVFEKIGLLNGAIKFMEWKKENQYMRVTIPNS